MFVCVISKCIILSINTSVYCHFGWGLSQEFSFSSSPSHLFFRSTCSSTTLPTVASMVRSRLRVTSWSSMDKKSQFSTSTFGTWHLFRMKPIQTFNAMTHANFNSISQTCAKGRTKWARIVTLSLLFPRLLQEGPRQHQMGWRWCRVRGWVHWCLHHHWEGLCMYSVFNR